MKFQTTQKAVKNGYQSVICVPYCALQNILAYENPRAYTVRREGWGADIYEVAPGVAISTGYAPFGNVRPSYETMRKYDRAMDDIPWQERKDAARELLRQFVEEVTA